jgi:LacI family transcriptional regulator
LATVAASCGVSVMTVSMILNGKQGLFKPDTAKRVAEAAASLGYRPNSFARSMRSGRMNAISMLAVTDKSQRKWFPASLLNGAMAELYSKDIQLNVTNVPVVKIEGGCPFPKIFREWCTDGLLINYVDHLPQAMLDHIEKAGIPALCLNTVRDDMDCVFPDDEGNFHLATEKLISLGHRRILFLSFQPHSHYSYNARRDGYRRAMAEASLEIAEYLPTERFEPLTWPDAVKPFLKAEKRPTAIVCALGCHDAIPVLLAAETLGLAVPKELSIITSEDSWDIPYERFTFVELPFEKLGREAASRILLKVDDPSLRFGKVPVSGELRNDGLSVAPPPAL